MNELNGGEATKETSGAIRVGIVDPRAMFREGLAALLASTPDFRAAVTGDSLAATLGLPLARSVNVWLVDARDHFVEQALPPATKNTSPPRGGFPADVGFVLLDDEWSLERCQSSTASGVDAYLSKGDAFERLLATLRSLPAVEKRLFRDELRRTYEAEFVHERRSLGELTVRELEILRHLAQGHSVRNCSQLLRIAPSTIENHKANMMKKLKVHKTVELVRIAIRAGLVEA